MTERSEMPRLEVVEGKIISLSAFSSPINKGAVVVLCLSCVCDLLRCVSALLLFLQKTNKYVLSILPCYIAKLSLEQFLAARQGDFDDTMHCIPTRKYRARALQ